MIKRPVDGIIVDLGLSGLEKRLRADHPLWRVESAFDLLCIGVKMHSDYSLIRFAEKHNLLLITNDKENMLSCDENDIPVIHQIPLRENAHFAFIEKDLQRFEIYEPKLEMTIIKGMKQ